MQPLRYNRNTLFTDDLLYQYMLESDIQEVKTLCITDKNASKLCNETFWTQKMMYDDLPIYKTPSMTEYQRVIEAVHQANQIDLNRFIINITLNESVMVLFNHIRLNEDAINELEYYDASLYQTHHIRIGGEQNSYDIFINAILHNNTADFFLLRFNKEDIHQILINLFYYYPHVGYNATRYITY